jgi:hypothetical protein
MEILFSDKSFGRRLEAFDFPDERQTKLAVPQEKVISAGTCEWAAETSESCEASQRIDSVLGVFLG